MKPFKRTTLSILVAAAATMSLAGCQSTPANTSNSASTADIQVIKSQVDQREYQYKQLSNGLKVIAVSDPTADKAAAALDVHIGHLADPANREGLSHFLEHMLFLGNKKYPEVGEYGEFVKKNGGYTNAGTGMEHTNYFFQIDNAAFEPALDRFSQFFVSPLFDENYVQKEKNAVHSEYKLKVKQDSRRFNEALKQTSNQAHPMTQFSVGNLDTLSDTENSSIIADVKAHYNKYYSAGIMSLVVVGDYPVEQLMKWAEDKFSAVPNNGYER